MTTFFSRSRAHEQGVLANTVQALALANNLHSPEITGVCTVIQFGCVSRFNTEMSAPLNSFAQYGKRCAWVACKKECRGVSKGALVLIEET